MRIVLILFLLVCAIIINSTEINEKKFTTRFEWKQVEFFYPRYADRSAAIQKHEYEPKNIMPISFSIHKRRVFLAFSRWKTGVPASLGYFDMPDDAKKNPLVSAYPNLKAHNMSSNKPEIISPIRVRVDGCDRLWVLDLRIIRRDGKLKYYGAAQLLVYNLKNDALLNRYELPLAQNESFILRGLALDDAICSETYAYLGSLPMHGLLVYSLKENKARYINTDSMESVLIFGKIKFNNESVGWTESLERFTTFSNSSRTSTIYLHHSGSTIEYNLNSGAARQQKTKNKEEKIIFYAMQHINAISCCASWQPDYRLGIDNTVYASEEELAFPNDLAIDQAGQLWVLTNPALELMQSELNSSHINFRILVGNITHIIKGTVCDLNPTLDEFELKNYFRSSSKIVYENELINLFLFLLLLTLIHTRHNVFMLLKA